MISLVIDASTYVGTAAVLSDSRLLAAGEAAMRGATEERLMPLVSQVIREAGLSAARELDQVVCGSGPGSFTSLRIAASIAKGIAVGAERPLLSLSSLGLLAINAASLGDGAGVYAATLNALRDEWYVAVYDVRGPGSIELQAAPVVADHEAVYRMAEEWNASIVGDLAGDGTRPTAAAAAHAAPGMLRLEDPAAWEPAYGRLAEAQVKWEAAHGRALGTA